MNKITVNGVSYDSIDAMPPDVRRVYEQSTAGIPELADRDGDGIPDLVKNLSFSPRTGTNVRKRLIVNGVEYSDVSTMPPDVRQQYDRAMQALAAGGPNVKKNEIKLSFQVTGPGFQFGAGTPISSTVQPLSGGQFQPIRPIQPKGAKPIEPGSGGGALRFAWILAACMGAGLAVWLLTRAH